MITVHAKPRLRYSRGNEVKLIPVVIAWPLFHSLEHCGLFAANARSGLSPKWLFANAVILLILLCVRFGPNLLRLRRTAHSEAASRYTIESKKENTASVFGNNVSVAKIDAESSIALDVAQAESKMHRDFKEES